MDDEDYRMMANGFADIHDQLVNINANLHFFVDIRKKEIAVIDEERKKSWEYTKTQSLVVHPDSEQCIYCGAQSHHLLRGNQILGCLVCVTTAINFHEGSKIILWGGKRMKEGKCTGETRCLACDRLGSHLEPME
jgi:hypothetical protein